MARILLIEPDRLLAQTYRQSLQAQGHRVRWSGNAQRAIHFIDARQPDIIVLELQLADHGGIEFLYELRSYPEWHGIPIVVHSFVPTYLFSDNIQQIEKVGITQYLYKPATTLRQLNRAVSQALETVRA
jgi:CheY-like chemotaxis protein